MEEAETEAYPWAEAQRTLNGNAAISKMNGNSTVTQWKLNDRRVFDVIA